jgi:hypothetical protein
MAGLCQDCTACCQVFEVKDEKLGLDKAFGEPCKFLGRDIHGPGCGIYHDRPDACRNYVCLWLEAARSVTRIAPEDMRPNVSGCVLGWPWGIDRETLHVYPIPGHPKYPDAWRVPPVSDYLQDLLRRGGKLMIFIEGKRIAIRGDMAVIGTEEEFEQLTM